VRFNSGAKLCLFARHPTMCGSRTGLSVQHRLWTRDYSAQTPENVGLAPQYFALSLADLVVETADVSVRAAAGPDLGQRVELPPNVFGLRVDFDLRFRGAIGHPWRVPAPSHR
jgi:hypothetical protein